ncbi:MAG: ferritin-like domain-containing protein [Candidatus Velthaea sp.]
MNTISRSALLGAGSAIALVGLPLMTSFVEAAAAADKNDIAALNAAIELERAGIKAYVDAAATGLISPGVLKVAQGFIADHTAHRDALIAAVIAGGGQPSSNTVKLAYPPLKTEADILRFALVVEQKAASTYLSVIPDLKDRALAGVAGSILGVETTHVALISNALGERAYKSGFVA